MEVKEVRGNNGTVIGAVLFINGTAAVLYAKSSYVLNNVAAAIMNDPDLNGSISTVRPLASTNSQQKDWINATPEYEWNWSWQALWWEWKSVSAAGLTNEQFIELQRMPGEIVGASCEAAAQACGSQAQVFIHNRFLDQVKGMIQKQLDSAD